MEVTIPAPKKPVKTARKTAAKPKAAPSPRPKAPKAKPPAKKKPAPPSTREAALLTLVTESLENSKAQDIAVLDLKGKTSIADYMVVASGTSQRHVSAIADHLVEKLRDGGWKGVTAEGRKQSDWVLVDAITVIIHIFRPEARTFYSLEKMWSVHLPPEA